MPAEETAKRLRIAWISTFPIEWCPDMPASIQALPKDHPFSWLRVLADELAKRPEIELHVVVVRKSLPRSEVIAVPGITFHLVKTPPYVRAPSLFWVDTWYIRKVLRTIRPDVVHAWGTEKGAAFCAQRLGYPYLVSMQGILSWHALHTHQNSYERLITLLERRAIPRMPLVVAESRYAANYIRVNLKPRRTEHVEYPPAPLFAELPRQPVFAPRRFLFVGTPRHLKGIDLLLSAFERLAGEMDFELRIVGKPNRDHWETERARHPQMPWERVVIREDLTRQEVCEELGEAAVFVFPSRAETGPLSIKEAVIAGVPVVASRIGGIPDYIDHGRNGFLFDSGDLDAFTEAIREAAVHPLFSVGKVDPATLDAKREYLSPARSVNRFIELYRETATGTTDG